MKLSKVICKLGAIIVFAFPMIANSTMIIIDNTDAGFSSSGLRVSTASCCVGSAIGGNYMVDQQGSQGDYAMWDPTGNVDWAAGIWKVEMNWTAYWNRSKAVLVNIDSGLSSLFVNQRFNGGKWIDLGTYTFSQATASVKIDDSNSTATSYFVADAVRFTLISKALDTSVVLDPKAAVASVPAPSSLSLFAIAALALIRLRKSK